MLHRIVDTYEYTMYLPWNAVANFDSTHRNILQKHQPRPNKHKESENVKAPSTSTEYECKHALAFGTFLSTRNAQRKRQKWRWMQAKWHANLHNFEMYVKIALWLQLTHTTVYTWDERSLQFSRMCGYNIRVHIASCRVETPPYKQLGYIMVLRNI